MDLFENEEQYKSEKNMKNEHKYNASWFMASRSWTIYGQDWSARRYAEMDMLIHSMGCNKLKINS